MNSISGLFRILEFSTQYLNNNQTCYTKLTVDLMNNQFKSDILELSIWGNLANFIIEYYTVNDFIIAEAYLSRNTPFLYSQDNKIKKAQVVTLTVINIYPVLLCV